MYYHIVFAVLFILSQSTKGEDTVTPKDQLEKIFGPDFDKFLEDTYAALDYVRLHSYGPYKTIYTKLLQQQAQQLLDYNAAMTQNSDYLARQIRNLNSQLDGELNHPNADEKVK